MSDLPTTAEGRKIIASVTLLLVENRDRVRYCDTISSIDESKMTPSDAAKFQFHCFHWFAAMQEIVIRKLVREDEVLHDELRKHAEELRLIKGPPESSAPPET
jgi:hypothetical protein